jgi:hypothetical protein
MLLPAMPLAAMEVVMNDLQLTVASLPTAYDFTLGNGTTERSGSDALGWHGGLRLGYRHDLGGPDRTVAPVLGIEIGTAFGAIGDGTLRSTTIGLVPGIAWGATDRTAVVVALTAAVGRAQVDLPDTTDARGIAASGRVTSLAVRVEGHYLLNRQWALGGELGWTQERYVLGGDAELGLIDHGWSMGVMLLYRFSFMPHRLE